MAITLSVKINNVDVDSGPVRITDDYPVITWSFSQTNKVIIDEYAGEIREIVIPKQSGYEIRISISNINWGEGSFPGNRINTGFVKSTDRFWNYYGVPLKRGITYYGQIFIENDVEKESRWKEFTFVYNSLPRVGSVVISPEQPSVTANLVLSYNFIDLNSDTDQGSLIRWFKNGVYQRQFNGLFIVSSNFLQIKDIWYADVVPFDGYEYGIRVSSPSVIVTKTSLTVSNVKILPESPNENSLLKVDYDISDLSEKENVSIRWFIRGFYETQYDDMIYIRPIIYPGDTVRCELKSKLGTAFLSSDEKTIGYSDFIIYDIMVDGRKEPLDTSVTIPTIGWKADVPYGLSVNYTSVRIGTFYEASNIYSEVIQNDKRIFTVPSNLLERGMDYYFSVAVSNTTVFDRYYTTHFRIKGSRWEENVSNSTGWTIETMFLIESSGDFDEGEYQFIRLSDGNYYGEIRIYNKKIGFISETLTLSSEVETGGLNILTIVGKDSDIKIYLNRQLVIDGIGLLTQEADQKRLIFGNDIGIKDVFIVRYKYFSYSVSGDYHPGTAEYVTVKFHTYLNFPENEVISMRGYVKNYKQYKVFAVNPDKTEEGASIYGLVSNEVVKASTVSRTMAPINKIASSPDSSKIVFAHSKGISVIEGYVINPFDHEIIFTEDDDTINQIYPTERNWLLIQNMGVDAAYFDGSGFNIDTIRNI